MTYSGASGVPVKAPGLVAVRLPADRVVYVSAEDLDKAITLEQVNQAIVDSLETVIKPAIEPAIEAVVDTAIDTHNENANAHRNLNGLGGGGGGGARYEQSFTNADLSIAGILVVNHGFGVHPGSVRITDSLGDLIFPDSEEELSENTIAIGLQSFTPLQGTLRLVING